MIVKRIIRAQYVTQRTDGHNNFFDAFVGQRPPLAGLADRPGAGRDNIAGVGGPRPDSWIDSHITLEGQILARERALGMMPVL